jgi:hypothetical protein
VKTYLVSVRFSDAENGTGGELTTMVAFDNAIRVDDDMVEDAALSRLETSLPWSEVSVGRIRRVVTKEELVETLCDGRLGPDTAGWIQEVLDHLFPDAGFLGEVS